MRGQLAAKTEAVRGEREDRLGRGTRAGLNAGIVELAIILANARGEDARRSVGSADDM